MFRLSVHNKIRLLHTAWRALSDDKHSHQMFQRGLARVAVNYGDGSVLWISTEQGWTALEDYLEKRCELVVPEARKQNKKTH